MQSDQPRETAPERGDTQPPEPVKRPDIGRREFVSLAGLAVLGVAAGCRPVPTSSPPPPAPATVVVTETPGPATAPFAWRDFGELSSVSVAADAAARSYPPLVPGDAFDSHPSVALLGRALGALGDGSPVRYLRTLVTEGATVLVKPNWVEPSAWTKAKITHPSLVLALAVWAAEAVGDRGRVVIGEGTSEAADLPRILEAMGFEKALAAFRSARPGLAPIAIVDLNRASAGRLTVDLGGLSRFAQHDGRMYDAHGKSMGAIGDGRVGSYLLAKPVVDADLVIDVAKAKVHSSAGVTLSLKNLLGIVPSADGPYGDDRLKDVPHFSAEDAEAGREYVRNGTIGYSAADLAALTRYTARDGSVQRKEQRTMLCVVDGVLSGQASQFTPEPVETGWVVAGTDPVAVDHAAARCMGFDPLLVRSLAPAAKGTLALGSGDPRRVRIRYTGSEAFAAYFSKRRRLKPEVKTVDWGDAMALASFGAAPPKVSIADGRLSARVAADVVAVRLESAAGFVALTRAPDGRFAASLPADGARGLRLTAVDGHFGFAEVTLGG